MFSRKSTKHSRGRSKSPHPKIETSPVVPPSVPEETVPEPKPVKKVVKPPSPKSIVPPGTTKVLEVGTFVIMNADISDCDAVIVRGNLDGKIETKYLVVQRGGCVRGLVSCDDAEVAGSFEGTDLVTSNRLIVRKAARVGGSITYNKLIVEEGAVVTGELMFRPFTEPGKILTSEMSRASTPPIAPLLSASTAPAATPSGEDPQEDARSFNNASPSSPGALVIDSAAASDAEVETQNQNGHRRTISDFPVSLGFISSDLDNVPPAPPSARVRRGSDKKIRSAPKR